MDHVAVLKALPEARKAAMTMRSDAAGLRHLALYLICLVCTTLYIALQAPYWGLALLPQGLLLTFLFTLAHECTHQTPFRTRWLNEAVGHALAPILFLPFQWFRLFHMAHHKYTNDPARDPEIADRPRPGTWRAYALYLTGWGYWRGLITVLLRNAFADPSAPYIPPRKHPVLRREARLVLGVQVAVLLTLIWSPLAFWLWMLPMLIGQPFLRLYLLAEHGLCPPVANMLENTRTTFTNRLVRFLAWNMPYHAEHHAAPNVPFHQLPELHSEMQEHLISTSDGYRSFTRAYLRHLS